MPAVSTKYPAAAEAGSQAFIVWSTAEHAALDVIQPVCAAQAMHVPVSACEANEYMPVAQATTVPAVSTKYPAAAEAGSQAFIVWSTAEHAALDVMQPVCAAHAVQPLTVYGSASTAHAATATVPP